MKKCIVYTNAYNAEKTIRCTMSSMQSQTHRDWIWYIVDNGSTDETGKIIGEYAKHDTRIIYLSNKENNVWEEDNSFWSFIENSRDCEYFCWLDADDEYKSEFLEKMVAFMEEKNLDMACCGSDFIDAFTKKTVGHRSLPQELIIDSKENFSKFFPVYHQFMRTVWGKLYRISRLLKLDIAKIPQISYGWDTCFSLEALRHANSMGIITGTLHKYYMSSKSSSYRFDPKRIEADYIVHQHTLEYLAEKCDGVSLRNEDFLLIVYMNAIKDTLNILLKADMSNPEKLGWLADIFDAAYTKTLMARENIGILSGFTGIHEQRRAIFSSIAKWLLALTEVPDEYAESFTNMGELACAVAEMPNEWVFFQKVRIRLLIEDNRTEEARIRAEDLEPLIPGDPEIKEFQSLLH